MKEKELMTLDRDYEAVGLLGGKKLVLAAGSQVLVTRFSQDGFTVRTQDGLLMRIPTPDAPIGKAKAEAPGCASEKSSSTAAFPAAESTMGEILQGHPAAKVGLFQRYHIGGCAACGYELAETLGEVCRRNNIEDPIQEVIRCILQSGEVEARLHIEPHEVAAALNRREPLRLLDVRSQEEWEAGHIPGAQLLNVELTFEILDSWSKDSPIVFYSNHGRRSLDKASYFTAYGMSKTKSIDGGWEAWRKLKDK